MKTPANYKRFIRLFGTLTTLEQSYLLSLIAPPMKVCRALKKFRGQKYNELKRKAEEASRAGTTH